MLGKCSHLSDACYIRKKKVYAQWVNVLQLNQVQKKKLYIWIMCLFCVYIWMMFLLKYKHEEIYIEKSVRISFYILYRELL